MSKGSDKRQAIFDIYKANLNLLVENKVIEIENNVYICPICLKHHKEINDEDPLTLEDAPPASLGGTANTLTCKSCNNTAGYKIDVHLVERLREIDRAKFPPGLKSPIKVAINGEVIQGTLIVGDDGSMQISHSPKNNNPDKLEIAKKELYKGNTLNVKFLKCNVIPENLEYALLKTGYILAFEKLGYSLMLEYCFEIVRQQLRNPENRIYPDGFWFRPGYAKSHSGVYFVQNKGLECLLVLFNLETGFSERLFGTFLPLPIHPIQEVINSIQKLLAENEEYNIELYPLEQEDMHYLDNLNEINAMNSWIKARMV